MEVTKFNFYELLPEIKEAIDNCDFISIDCELTGLYAVNNINSFDTQKQYYEKLRRSSKQFIIIQYGLCMFRHDETSNTFFQQGYNFYIFPHSGNKHVPDHRFLCQSSCIDFLSQCGFDFNKLFKEGIPYLNAAEEDKYKEKLNNMQTVRANKMLNNFSPDIKNHRLSMTIEERAFIDGVFKEIEDFIVSDETERILPKCSPYLRRLLYQEAQIKLANKASLETKVLNKNERILVVTRSKDLATLEKENNQTVEGEEDEFKKCIGFSTIIRMIVESEKLVIGHNMCLDLFHTIDQFLTPLPQSYEEFKELANFSFSKILDTKYMSSAIPFKGLITSNVLLHLLETLKKKPFEMPNIEIEENRKGYTLQCDKEHEAGYDAYITGVCFLTMWNFLFAVEEESHRSFPDMFLLTPYLNRLILTRLQDTPCIHLGGVDATPSRDNVLYLSFPKSWKLNDIMQLFSPFGNVYVSWIDDSSAFVNLHRKDQLPVALRTLSQSGVYKIMTYTEYERLRIGQHNSPSSLPFLSTQQKLTTDNSTPSLKKRETNFENLKNKFNKRSILDTDNTDLPTSLTDTVLNKKQKMFDECVTWD
ncbi:hypothetical protein FQA39_LY01354 [Lamprigera yunnana]|nr:hypothetical protein FQA39_LY01354 [Lamprigera yunnana]